jgi:hypothetical protein
MKNYAQILQIFDPKWLKIGPKVLTNLKIF